MSGSTEDQDDTPDSAVTLRSPARPPLPARSADPAVIRPPRQAINRRSRGSRAVGAPGSRPCPECVDAPRPQLPPDHVAAAHRQRWQRAAPPSAAPRSPPPRCRSHNALSHPVRARRKNAGHHWPRATYAATDILTAPTVRILTPPRVAGPRPPCCHRNSSLAAQGVRRPSVPGALPRLWRQVWGLASGVASPGLRQVAKRLRFGWHLSLRPAPAACHCRNRPRFGIKRAFDQMLLARKPTALPPTFRPVDGTRGRRDSQRPGGDHRGRHPAERRSGITAGRCRVASGPGLP